MKQKFKIIVEVLFAIILTGGFMSVFSNIFENESRSALFVLVTLPLIVGSVLTPENYKLESRLFMASAVALILGLLMSLSTSNGIAMWLGIITLNIGVFIFCFALIKLGYKLYLEIYDILRKGN